MGPFAGKSPEKGRGSAFVHNSAAGPFRVGRDRLSGGPRGLGGLSAAYASASAGGKRMGLEIDDRNPPSFASQMPPPFSREVRDDFLNQIIVDINKEEFS